MNSGDLRPRHDDSIAVLGAHPDHGASHLECFADEVVIDFPSVAGAVERMRRPFETDGAGRDPLAVDVSVSHKQALEGATLSVDAPIRCTCRDCGGRGETWPERCAACTGTGIELRFHQVQVSIPCGVGDGARFRFLVTPRHELPTPIELRVAIR